jgi:hypothetical protein
MEMAFEVAGFPEAQVREEVNTQVTISPLAGLYWYILLLFPMFTPFTFHWYEGIGPPLVGVAVNATRVPAQIGFREAAIETLTGIFVIATIMIWLERAGLPLTQVKLEVTWQVTVSPLFGGYV